MVSGGSLGLCCLLRLGLVGSGADDGRTINGILYVLTTGCRWMDMPAKYGSYKTAWRRLKRWQDEGVWDRIFRALASVREHGRVCVDSSTVEAKKGRNDRI